jgi:hypothetical protein
MSAHRFVVTIDGEVLHGLLFANEHELDEFLAGRPSAPEPTTQRQAQAPLATPRRGRPSHAQAIDAAVRALGRRLNRRKPVAEQARRVLHHLAQTVDDPDMVPKRRTVEIALRRKTRGKGRG